MANDDQAAMRNAFETAANYVDQLWLHASPEKKLRLQQYVITELAPKLIDDLRDWDRPKEPQNVPTSQRKRL